MGVDGLFGMQAANGGPHVGIQKESWNPSVGFYASSMAVHLALLQTFHFLCKLHFEIVTSSYVQIIRSHAPPFLRAVLFLLLAYPRMPLPILQYLALTLLPQRLKSLNVSRNALLQKMGDFDSWS